MSKPATKIKLLVLGVHLCSEGYPNVRYRIRDFRKAAWLETTEINVPMWRKGAQSNHSKLGFLLGLFRAVYAHLSVITKYLLRGRAAQVYVPYPSVFVCLFLGLLPRFVKPDRIVLDAFISLYDTAVIDRKLLSSGNRLSVWLKWLERKAYSIADLVIVDTPQNVSYLCREFSLSETKVVDVPLSTDEQNFQLAPYLPKSENCQVLFVGTFIPLHGVSAILAAAQRLKQYRNIQFKIIGDGQTATAIASMVDDDTANLVWERNWKKPSELAGLIHQADICLGIFGIGGKTQRVCPLKLYAYAACGRAIITADTEWTRHVRRDISYTPFETVEVNDGAALSDQIKQLANSSEHRQKLAENSRRFYSERLCNEIAMSKLKELLCEL